MYCTKCAAENPDDARFCGKCGATIHAQAPTSAPPTSQAAPPASASVSNGLKWGIFWAAALFPPAGLVMGLIYVFDPDPAKKAVGKFWLITAVIAIFVWSGIYSELESGSY